MSQSSDEGGSTGGSEDEKKRARAQPAKKGPGRPRKTPKKEPPPRQGLRSKQDENSVLEFFYSIPTVFKKIINFFKALESAQIQFIFRPAEVILYGEDHFGKSKIRVRFDGTKMHRYYCEKEFEIGLSTSELLKITNKVDKDYTSIVINSKKSNTNKSIDILYWNELSIQERHKIELIQQYNQLSNDNEFNDEKYQLSFNLPGKYFKKTMTDIKNISDKLNITKEIHGVNLPIYFNYISNNKKIQCRHVIKHINGKINVECNMRPNETVRVDLKVEYIKPIASSHISDNIRIYVDENKKLLTKAYIDDDAIEIKTLTEIIKSNENEE